MEEVTSSERKSARQAVLSIARRVRGKAKAEASEAVASVSTDESERRINELKKYNEQRLRDVEYEKDSEMLRALKSAHAQKRDELQQKEKELERDAAKALSKRRRRRSKKRRNLGWWRPCPQPSQGRGRRRAGRCWPTREESQRRSKTCERCGGQCRSY